MNSTLNDCLTKMSTLELNENEEKELLKSTAGSSIWMDVTALTSDYDSDGVQSAPELGNTRLVGQNYDESTQNKRRYWTCGQITSKKKRKRHFDVYNCMTVKRKRSHNEIKEIVQDALENPQITYEIGYDADDEYP